MHARTHARNINEGINNPRFQKKKTKKKRLEAGGKPSTWFPPGILVELIEANEFVHYLIQIILHFDFQNVRKTNLFFKNVDLFDPEQLRRTNSKTK